MEKPVLASAVGLGARIDVFADRVVITRTGLLGAMSGLGDTEVAIGNIAAVRFKRAGFFSNGFIQLAFAGGPGMHGNEMLAARDANSVVFSTWKQRQFEEVKMRLEEVMRSSREQVNQGRSAGLTDLEQLASLRDRGIITEAEFTAKKRQILGF